jgi:hypothetical protein
MAERTKTIRRESHVTRCLIGSVNKTALLFSAVCELSAVKAMSVKRKLKKLVR